MTQRAITETHIAGMLFGAAFGDALAAPVEFISDVQAIRQQFPPAGPEDLHQGLVTDDTQMMLAVARALLETPELRAEPFKEALRRHFVAWLNSPENDRAPGITCLRACEQLERGLPWPQATVLGSKGCGANMRVQPLAIIAEQATRAGAAQLQAALTHGHATALATSDLTAQALRLLLTGLSPQALSQTLLDYVETQGTVYHHDWLGELWTLTPAPSPEAFVQRGWEECHLALERALTVVRRGLGERADPCQFSGEGWIAEEAFATALLCFLLNPDHPIRALQRAATTSGDSDSIACLTGSLAGAYLGLSAFPTDWPQRIEYGEQLRSLSDAFTRSLI